MKKIAIVLVTVLVFTSCKETTTVAQKETPRIIISVAPVKQGTIEAPIILNGKTVFLKQNLVLSSLTGYITNIYVKLGDRVSENQTLFDIQTKENKVLDTKNITHIIAPSSGVVNSLNVTENDIYIAEGSPLCSVVEDGNLMIKVSVPFEYLNLITASKLFKIVLSDNTVINGSLYKIFTTVNEVSQTQDVYIKPLTNRRLPENLNVSIEIVRETHQQVYIVPKSALLTNETQSKFWVMKFVNDMAINILITKGIENDSLVEINAPQIKLNDLLITEGAYGLPDSTTVTLKN